MQEYVPYQHTLYVNFSVAIDWDELKSKPLAEWRDHFGWEFESYFQLAEYVAKRLFETAQDKYEDDDWGYARVQPGGRFAVRRPGPQSGLELDCIRNGVEDNKVVTIKVEADQFVDAMEELKQKTKDYNGTIYDTREDVGIDLFDCEG